LFRNLKYQTSPAAMSTVITVRPTSTPFFPAMFTIAAKGAVPWLAASAAASRTASTPPIASERTLLLMNGRA
jgi:hypothetical protein